MRFTALALAATIGVTLFVSVPTAHAQFTTNFNSVPNGGSPAFFANDSNTWSVSNPSGASGTYSSTIPGFGFFYSTITAPGYTDIINGTISVDIFNVQDSGLILRSDANARNGVSVIVRPTNNDFYFIRRANGNFVGTNLASTSLTNILSPGDNARLTFSSSMNTFTATVVNLADTNRTATISFTFSNGVVPESGRAGLYQSPFGGAPARFDNLTLINAPEPGTLALLAPLALGIIAGFARRRTSV